MSHDNRQFPHLLQPDIDLWKRYLADDPDNFIDYDYDVRVGAGRDPGSAAPENIRKMSLDLSQRRIDAIGYKADSLTIIEITLSAGLRAIGQLVAYPTLFNITHNPTQPIAVLLIAEEIQTDMLPVIEVLKIPFRLYPK